MKRVERARPAAENGTGYEALRSMLKGEYTEESTGARTIRQSGGKDRHSKVFTSRGPRDRRVRLSVATAIRFYDLQDRLGFDQPSKAVEWLLLHCQTSIQALPQLATLHPSHSMVSGQQTPYSSSQNKLFAFQAKPASHFHSTSPLTSSLCLFTPSSNYATSNHAQISSDEDPPQCSNPSSGASSDNPITPLDGLYPNPLTLSKPSPANDQNVSTLVSQHTSSSSRPMCPYASKRKRIQIPLLDTSHHTHVQADDYASSTTNSIDSFGSHAVPLHQDMSNPLQAEKLIDMFNETLFGNHSSIHSNKNFVSASGTNDNKTTLISNPLQNQPNFMEQQASKILSSAIDGLNHVNTTQLFCDGQESSQTTSHALVQQHLVESLCNMHSLMEAGAYHADNALLQLTDASRGTYDNIDELNNVYRMPSPAESTSISRLGGDYSGAGIIMTNNQAQANLYRQCWPSVPNNLLRQDPFLHANFQ